METLTTVVESDIFQIILKLLLSSFLAGFIGIERSALSKPAGFGTYSIIGLSSALVVMASEYMSFYYDIDVSRIPSQILAGIGFIGAGTILRNGVTVKGVTTAAGILSVTCIGMAVGIGYYFPAVLATILVFIILSVNHEVAGKFERFELLNLSIIISSNAGKTIEDIEKYFKEEKIEIKSIKKEENYLNSRKNTILKIIATYDVKKTDKNEVISYIISNKDVSEVLDESHLN